MSVPLAGGHSNNVDVFSGLTLNSQQFPWHLQQQPAQLHPRTPSSSTSSTSRAAAASAAETTATIATTPPSSAPLLALAAAPVRSSSSPSPTSGSTSPPTAIISASTRVHVPRPLPSQLLSSSSPPPPATSPRSPSKLESLPPPSFSSNPPPAVAAAAAASRSSPRSPPSPLPPVDSVEFISQSHRRNSSSASTNQSERLKKSLRDAAAADADGYSNAAEVNSNSTASATPPSSPQHRNNHHQHQRRHLQQSSSPPPNAVASSPSSPTIGSHQDSYFPALGSSIRDRQQQLRQRELATKPKLRILPQSRLVSPEGKKDQPPSSASTTAPATPASGGTSSISFAHLPTSATRRVASPLSPPLSSSDDAPPPEPPLRSPRRSVAPPPATPISACPVAEPNEGADEAGAPAADRPEEDGSSSSSGEDSDGSAEEWTLVTPQSVELTPAKGQVRLVSPRRSSATMMSSQPQQPAGPPSHQQQQQQQQQQQRYPPPQDPQALYSGEGYGSPPQQYVQHMGYNNQQAFSQNQQRLVFIHQQQPPPPQQYQQQPQFQQLPPQQQHPHHHHHHHHHQHQIHHHPQQQQIPPGQQFRLPSQQQQQQQQQPQQSGDDAGGPVRQPSFVGLPLIRRSSTFGVSLSKTSEDFRGIAGTPSPDPSQQPGQSNGNKTNGGGENGGRPAYPPLPPIPQDPEPGTGTALSYTQTPLTTYRPQFPYNPPGQVGNYQIQSPVGQPGQYVEGGWALPTPVATKPAPGQSFGGPQQKPSQTSNVQNNASTGNNAQAASSAPRNQPVPQQQQQQQKQQPQLSQQQQPATKRPPTFNPPIPNGNPIVQKPPGAGSWQIQESRLAAPLVLRSRQSQNDMSEQYALDKETGATSRASASPPDSPARLPPTSAGQQQQQQQQQGPQAPTLRSQFNPAQPPGPGPQPSPQQQNFDAQSPLQPPNPQFAQDGLSRIKTNDSAVSGADGRTSSLLGNLRSRFHSTSGGGPDGPEGDGQSIRTGDNVSVASFVPGDTPDSKKRTKRRSLFGIKSDGDDAPPGSKESIIAHSSHTLDQRDHRQPPPPPEKKGFFGRVSTGLGRTSMEKTEPQGHQRAQSQPVTQPAQGPGGPQNLQQQNQQQPPNPQFFPGPQMQTPTQMEKPAIPRTSTSDAVAPGGGMGMQPQVSNAQPIQEQANQPPQHKHRLSTKLTGFFVGGSDKHQQQHHQHQHHQHQHHQSGAISPLKPVPEDRPLAQPPFAPNLQSGMAGPQSGAPGQQQPNGPAQPEQQRQGFPPFQQPQQAQGPQAGAPGQPQQQEQQQQRPGFQAPQAGMPGPGQNPAASAPGGPSGPPGPGGRERSDTAGSRPMTSATPNQGPGPNQGPQNSQQQQQQQPPQPQPQSGRPSMNLNPPLRTKTQAPSIAESDRSRRTSAGNFLSGIFGGKKDREPKIPKDKIQPGNMVPLSQATMYKQHQHHQQQQQQQQPGAPGFPGPQPGLQGPGFTEPMVKVIAPGGNVLWVPQSFWQEQQRLQQLQLQQQGAQGQRPVLPGQRSSSTQVPTLQQQQQPGAPPLGQGPQQQQSPPPQWPLGSGTPPQQLPVQQLRPGQQPLPVPQQQLPVQQQKQPHSASSSPPPGQGGPGSLQQQPTQRQQSPQPSMVSDHRMLPSQISQGQGPSADQNNSTQPTSPSTIQSLQNPIRKPVGSSPRAPGDIDRLDSGTPTPAQSDAAGRARGISVSSTQSPQLPPHGSPQQHTGHVRRVSTPGSMALHGSPATQPSNIAGVAGAAIPENAAAPVSPSTTPAPQPGLQRPPPGQGQIPSPLPSPGFPPQGGMQSMQMGPGGPPGQAQNPGQQPQQPGQQQPGQPPSRPMGQPMGPPAGMPQQQQRLQEQGPPGQSPQIPWQTYNQNNGGPQAGRPGPGPNGAQPEKPQSSLSKFFNGSKASASSVPSGQQPQASTLNKPKKGKSIFGFKSSKASEQPPKSGSPPLGPPPGGPQYGDQGPPRMYGQPISGPQGAPGPQPGQQQQPGQFRPGQPGQLINGQQQPISGRPSPPHPQGNPAGNAGPPNPSQQGQPQPGQVPQSIQAPQPGGPPGALPFPGSPALPFHSPGAVPQPLFQTQPRPGQKLVPAAAQQPKPGRGSEPTYEAVPVPAGYATVHAEGRVAHNSPYLVNHAPPTFPQQFFGHPALQSPQNSPPQPQMPQQRGNAATVQGQFVDANTPPMPPPQQQQMGGYPLGINNQTPPSQGQGQFGNSQQQYGGVPGQPGQMNMYQQQQQQFANQNRVQQPQPQQSQGQGQQFLSNSITPSISGGTFMSPSMLGDKAFNGTPPAAAAPFTPPQQGSPPPAAALFASAQQQLQQLPQRQEQQLQQHPAHGQTPPPASAASGTAPRSGFHPGSGQPTPARSPEPTVQTGGPTPPPLIQHPGSPHGYPLPNSAAAFSPVNPAASGMPNPPLPQQDAQLHQRQNSQQGFADNGLGPQRQPSMVSHVSSVGGSSNNVSRVASGAGNHGPINSMTVPSNETSPAPEKHTGLTSIDAQRANQMQYPHQVQTPNQAQGPDENIYDASPRLPVTQASPSPPVQAPVFQQPAQPEASRSFTVSPPAQAAQVAPAPAAPGQPEQKTLMTIETPPSPESGEGSPPSPMDEEQRAALRAAGGVSDDQHLTVNGEGGAKGGEIGRKATIRATSAEQFEEAKRKQLLRDLEEKIPVVIQEDEPAPARKADDEGQPKMSATSYPGQEWNPYGGEFESWDD